MADIFLFLDVPALKLRIIVIILTIDSNNSLDCLYNKKLSCLRLILLLSFLYTWHEGVLWLLFCWKSFFREKFHLDVWQGFEYASETI